MVLFNEKLASVPKKGNFFTIYLCITLFYIVFLNDFYFR